MIDLHDRTYTDRERHLDERQLLYLNGRQEALSRRPDTALTLSVAFVVVACAIAALGLTTAASNMAIAIGAIVLGAAFVAVLRCVQAHERAHELEIVRLNIGAVTERLSSGQVSEVEVTSSSVLVVEEHGDEGRGYVFAVSHTLLLVLAGQDVPSGSRFPNSHFVIVRELPSLRPIRFVLKGSPLSPVRRIPSSDPIKRQIGAEALFTCPGTLASAEADIHTFVSSLSAEEQISLSDGHWVGTA